MAYFAYNTAMVAELESEKGTTRRHLEGGSCVRRAICKPLWRTEGQHCLKVGSRSAGGGGREVGSVIHPDRAS